MVGKMVKFKRTDTEDDTHSHVYREGVSLPPGMRRDNGVQIDGVHESMTAAGWSFHDRDSCVFFPSYVDLHKHTDSPIRLPLYEHLPYGYERVSTRFHIALGYP